MLLQTLYRAAFAHVKLNAPAAHPVDVLAMVQKLVHDWSIERRE